MSTCYLVLGTPRSGTSCVAGILAHLGIFMGHRLIPANPMNEFGFYQDIDFEELFDDIKEWMPTHIEHYVGHPRLVKLTKLIHKRCATGNDWGVKFKHASMVLPEFISACKLPVKIIVTTRPTECSIASLQHWSEPHDQDARQVITRATAALTNVTKIKIDMLVVSYNDLCDNAPRHVAKLAAFVGRPVNRNAIEHVRPELRHY